MIQIYATTEVYLRQFCRRRVDRAAVRISQPADLHSSDILDSRAQGRGCIGVEATALLVLGPQSSGCG